MVLQLRKLMRPGEDTVLGREEYTFSESDFDLAHPEGPVVLQYEAVPGNGSVALHIRLEALLRGECGRCLGEAEYPLCAEKEYRITEADLAEEYPELPIENGGLDLREFTRGEVLIETPPVLLCREDCEGLCPECGKQAGSCGCEKEPEGDPRWNALRALLDQEPDN